MGTTPNKRRWKEEKEAETMLQCDRKRERERKRETAHDKNSDSVTLSV